MGEREDKRRIVHDLLAGAIPVNPQGAQYVTRDELNAKLEDIKTKIDNAALKQKIWVMGAALAIIASFGGGYVSLVAKLDSVVSELPELAKKQEQRSPWIQRVDQRDARQDDELKKIDNSYQPLPYQEPPQ